MDKHINCNDLIEKVTDILAGYAALKIKAQQLKFEIENYRPPATDEDVIDAMTFGKPPDAGSTHVHNSKISDKTARTAVIYKKEATTINMKLKAELENELNAINMEMMRLEYYIGLLKGNYSNVLWMLYIEGITYTDAAAELKVSISTLKKYRKLAIQKLAAMYETIIS